MPTTSQFYNSTISDEKMRNSEIPISSVHKFREKEHKDQKKRNIDDLALSEEL